MKWKWSGNGRETEGQWKGFRMGKCKTQNKKNHETIDTLMRLCKWQTISQRAAKVSKSHSKINLNNDNKVNINNKNIAT